MERERGKDSEGIGEIEKRDFFTLWWTGRTAARAKKCLKCSLTSKPSCIYYFLNIQFQPVGAYARVCAGVSA